MNDLPLVLLVQLPIPPPGPGPIEGNVPLAAACLKSFAVGSGLERSFAIELLPALEANHLGDVGLVDAILARRPWMVGFSCYVWNVERTLWIARQLRTARPELKIAVGGPEVTADNRWLYENPPFDFAVIGEGEATFAELLRALSPHLPAGTDADLEIAGLWRPGRPTATRPAAVDLDTIASPYRSGILDVEPTADGRRLLLETVRGCRFRCKYCYYPKGDATPRLLSEDRIAAELRFAAERGVSEIFLLDPTLNQRRNFADFLKLLRRSNPDGRLKFSGELRAEGIDADAAKLLREAGVHEVEIGLQSVEPRAWSLMGRPTNLAAFERGVRAILNEGIRVRTDLILGLPGDTVDSIRRGFDFLRKTHLYTEIQVFHLSILPGTEFRRFAKSLGLKYQPFPPYYVLQTPSLDVERLIGLMAEAEEAFGVEFDVPPPLSVENLRWNCDVDDRGQAAVQRGRRIDLDAATPAPTISHPALAFTLWLRSSNFERHRQAAAERIACILRENPHTTLLVVLEPAGDPRRLTVETLETLRAACYQTTTYLDRYYSLHVGTQLGAKRLVVALSSEWIDNADGSWRQAIAEYAAIVAL